MFAYGIEWAEVWEGQRRWRGGRVNLWEQLVE